MIYLIRVLCFFVYVFSKDVETDITTINTRMETEVESNI